MLGKSIHLRPYGVVCLLTSLTEVVIARQTHMNFITSVAAGTLER
jgi:hypothetical protein